jgi:hypothetical protein
MNFFWSKSTRKTKSQWKIYFWVDFDEKNQIKTKNHFCTPESQLVASQRFLATCHSLDNFLTIEHEVDKFEQHVLSLVMLCTKIIILYTRCYFVGYPLTVLQGSSHTYERSCRTFRPHFELSIKISKKVKNIGIVSFHGT